MFSAETSPGDLSTNDRGPPGCPVLKQTVTQTTFAKKNVIRQRMDDLHI